MKKKKRIICHFTNWLFAEYQVPKITGVLDVSLPTRLLNTCPFYREAEAALMGGTP